MEIKEEVVESLTGAMAEKTVADVFKAHGITSIVEKTKYLDEAQGTTKTYSIPGMADKDKYEMSLEAFLDPIWRELAK